MWNSKVSGMLSGSTFVTYYGNPGDSPYNFFFSSRRRHTTSDRDWSSDVCSSDLSPPVVARLPSERPGPPRSAPPTSGCHHHEVSGSAPTAPAAENTYPNSSGSRPYTNSVSGPSRNPRPSTHPPPARKYSVSPWSYCSG